MIDLEKILKLESNASDGPWDINAESCGFNEEDKLLIDNMRNDIRQICLELKAARKVVEAARPLVRALELCQVYRQDENIYKAFKNEIVLQLALKELDGEK